MYNYGYDNLKRIVNTEKGKKIVEFYKTEYENKYLGKPITPLNYSDYKLIYINGNRDEYQKVYYERVNRLMFLQILAISDDKYLEELENVLATICDEFTWVLPAHNLQKDNSFDYTVIDLFSSERAFYLSETAYVFKDKLSIDIKNRIKASLKAKIIDNYESRRFLWDDCHHNWAAVCSCGVGLTYLYQFPERFDAVKDRIFNSMNNYLSGVCDDGVITEGIGYLDYGFGFFCLFHDVYVQLTGDIPFTLKNPKIKKILEFANNSDLGNGLCLPFADGGFKWYYREANIYYTIKNLFEKDFNLPFVKTVPTYTKALAFRVLNGADKFGNKSVDSMNYGTIYYKQSEYFINKNKNYVFVAKCGDNCEMHNHNDVGCFEIIKNGKVIISDLGAGRYTWKYHNDQTENGRYGKEIFVCGSWGHSVPIVNGRPQINYMRSTGEKYGGKVLVSTDNVFKVDIARAYEDGLVDALNIEYILGENSLDVNYACEGIKNNITFRFITEQEPIVCGAEVKLADCVLISKSGIVPTVEEVFYETHSTGKKERCFTIDFAVEKGGKVNESFEIK